MSRKRRIGIALCSSLLVSAPMFAPLAHAKKKKAASSSESAATPEFQADAAPAAGQTSKTFERAAKLYQGDDYYSASIELNKVIEGESGDTEAVKQQAEFTMGKALYNMRFYSAALSYFDRIVQKGAGHAYYQATLKWLASLSRQLPDSTGILEKIGKYNRADLEQGSLEKVKDELTFLLGKYYYQKGQFKEAVELFRSVATSSEFYAEARLFEGATYVRQYQAKPAVEAFKEVLRTAAESDDPKIKPFEDLANLSLARVFYSTGQYELATKYFDRVSQESFDWANSLFESSWANFMLKQKGYSKALGNIHTIQAPFFENYIKPESVAEALTVKATIFFYNCLFDRATDAIREFNEVYPKMFEELRHLVQGTTDNAQLFELAVKIRHGKSGLPESIERAARSILSDRSLVKRFEYVDELTRELNQHERADAAWKNTNIAQNILADLTLQKSLAINEAGDLSRRRINRLTEELAQLIKRVIKIEYEIIQGEKGNVEQEVATEQQLSPQGREKRALEIKVDDEHILWPFTGEYWRDELGYYRVRVANRCDKTAPEGAPSTGEAPAGAEAPAGDAAPAEAAPAAGEEAAPQAQ